MKTLISALIVVSSLFVSCKKEKVVTEDFIVATLYYRLEMVDIDSSIKYSEIAATKATVSSLTQTKNQHVEIPKESEESNPNYCRNHPNSIRCKPLPVLLEYFKIDQVGSNYVRLKWNSITEDNFKAYHIQRSRDGKTYTNIAEVKPKGPSEYIYTDKLTK
jgi:hypothetical protein